MIAAARPVGELLREWRQRRRLSQLQLACEAEVSTRHLSFVETGRASPSREMVLSLAEQLEVPLRDRNVMLVSAGFAPVFPERPLSDPALEPARQAVDLVLRGHEPFPALAIDRHWTLVAANRIVPLLMAGADPSLLEPPINVLRLSLHPNGLASRIANLPDWHAHVVARLRRQCETTADTVLSNLLAEIESYPHGDRTGHEPSHLNEIATPFQYISDLGVLSFYSTTMMFGTPVDVTLSELAIESFFPADAATADALRRL